MRDLLVKWRRHQTRFGLVPWEVLITAVLLLAGPLVLTQIDPSVFQLAAIYTVACVGLTLMIGLAGQFTLGHGAVFAVGAYTYSILTTRLDLDPWLGLACAAVFGAVIGLVLGLPALRLRSHSLAMITLGFAIVTPELLIEWKGLTGGGDGISGIPLPTLGGERLAGDRANILFVTSALVATLALWLLLKSRWRTILLSVHEDEVGAAASGVRVVRAKVFAFTVASALGGFAGALFAINLQFVAPDQFGVALTLLFLTIIVFGGPKSLLGALVGAIALSYLPVLFSSFAQYSNLAYGTLLVLTQLVMAAGLIGALRLGYLYLMAKFAPRPNPARHPITVRDWDAFAPRPAGETLVKVTGVKKSFGGVAALSGVDLAVDAGQIHALIGPNGSGKSTLLNVIAGLYPPNAGVVTVRGERIRGMAQSRRLGVARTFQTPRTFPQLTLSESTALPLLARSGTTARQNRVRARAAMAALGLEEFADEHASDMTFGTQRLSEVARALVDEPGVVLLDEPAAGLAPQEIDDLCEVLMWLRERGRAILLVEHHVEMVARLADTVTVLDKGQVIAAGEPAAILRGEEIANAYLGRARERMT